MSVWSALGFKRQTAGLTIRCLPTRIVASFIYRQQYSPRYTLGHTVCIASLCLLYVPVLFNISKARDS